jgi:hypothetical protein
MIGFQLTPLLEAASSRLGGGAFWFGKMARIAPATAAVAAVSPSCGVARGGRWLLHRSAVG